MRREVCARAAWAQSPGVPTGRSPPLSGTQSAPLYGEGVGTSKSALAQEGVGGTGSSRKGTAAPAHAAVFRPSPHLPTQLCSPPPPTQLCSFKEDMDGNRPEGQEAGARMRSAFGYQREQTGVGCTGVGPAGEVPQGSQVGRAGRQGGTLCVVTPTGDR